MHSVWARVAAKTTTRWKVNKILMVYVILYIDIVNNPSCYSRPHRHCTAPSKSHSPGLAMAVPTTACASKTLLAATPNVIPGC